MSKQVRFIPTQNCGLQVREPQEGQTASRRIAGRPIVFGVRSNNLTPWSDYREVYEVLEPGCISAEVMQKSDIVLNTNHRNDVSCILGRYRNSDKDTLKLELRADGVDCDCDLPNTTTADDTLELIKRGDIDGMSFAFEDDWEDSENGVSYERMRDEETGKKEIWVRHVKRITALYDVSVVTHPAYEQTTVAVREEGDRINEAIEAQLKREQEAEGKTTEDKTEEETDEEREAREKAEREARELKEQEQREREAIATIRMRRNRIALMNRDLEDLFV
jgi:HK97 family phage prohead protease